MLPFVFRTATAAVAAVCAVLYSTAGHGAPDARPFVPLFNGRDLSGWTEQKKEGAGWQVCDGMLVSPAGSVSNLYSEKQYGDFVLRAEFLLEKEANNGIGIRTATEGGNPSSAGMEIQLLDDYFPGNARLPMENMCGSIYRIIPSRRNAVKPAGQWNSIQITAVGRRVEVVLNGKDVLRTDLNRYGNPAKYMEQPGFVRLSGHISLLGHKPSQVSFRSIEIQDISEPRPGNTPPPGFTALFNGHDLTGWKGLVASPPERAKMSPEQLKAEQEKADDQMRAHWKVVDGVLTYDGAGASLCTARDYRNFEMFVDWKIEPGGDSGIYLRGSPQVQIWDDPVGSGGLYNNQKNPSKPEKRADNPPGEWNTFHIVMVDERVNVFLNGHLVVKGVVMENYWERGIPIYPTGQIELQHHNSPLYFRNIFIRDLPGS